MSCYPIIVFELSDAEIEQLQGMGVPGRKPDGVAQDIVRERLQKDRITADVRRRRAERREAAKGAR